MKVRFPSKDGGFSPVECDVVDVIKKGEKSEVTVSNIEDGYRVDVSFDISKKAVDGMSGKIGVEEALKVATEECKKYLSKIDTELRESDFLSEIREFLNNKFSKSDGGELEDMGMCREEYLEEIEALTPLLDSVKSEELYNLVEARLRHCIKKLGELERGA